MGVGCNVSQTVELAATDCAVSGSHDVSHTSMQVDNLDGIATENTVSGLHDVSHCSMQFENSDARFVCDKKVGTPTAAASMSAVENNAKRSFNLEEAKNRLKQLKSIHHFG